MLTVHWCLFDWLNKGCLPPVSLCELSFSTTFSNMGLNTLSCVCARLFMLRGLDWKAFISLSMDSKGKKRLFPIQQNAIRSTTQQNIFIYLPSWCHFGLQNPWRGKCIKPLTVFTCTGLTLMCEGRPQGGGWEIDHQRMSVRGILISTTAFHTLSLKKIHQAETGCLLRILLLISKIETLLFVETLCVLVDCTG